jgi:hypothetical protein
MDVVEMAGDIAVVANHVLPEALLPKVLFATLNPTPPRPG